MVDQYSPSPEFIPLEEPAESSPNQASGSQRTVEEIRSSLGSAGGVRGTSLGGGAYQQADGRIVYLVNRSAAVSAAQGATPEEQIATRGQEGDALALLYGYAPHGGTTFFRRTIQSTGDLVIGIIWGMGPINEFVAIRNADGTALNPTITVENYRGDPADANYGTVDNKLLAADPTYSDTLVAIDEETGLEYAACYSVFLIDPFLWRSGWPQFQAWITGHPVYDPRDPSQIFGNFSTYKYKSNAALIQADLYTHPLRGMGLTIDWSTVEDPATSCDAGPRFRGIHTRFASSQPAGNLLEIAGEYASTTIVADQSTAKMVELKDETPIATLTVDDTIGGFTVVERPSANTPDIVEVDWSAPDLSESYRRVTRTVRAKRSGLTGNAHPYVRQRIPMPGFIAEDQAYQYAVRRLNGLGNDLEVSWVQRDTGLEYTRADVINIQDDNGLTNLRVRIVQATLQGRGRYTFKAVMDTAAQYSADPAPASPDVPPRYTGQSPVVPVPVDNVTIFYEIQYDEQGRTQYRARTRFNAVNWTFAQGYRFRFREDGSTQYFVDTTLPHQEGQSYDVYSEYLPHVNTTYEASVQTIGPYNDSTIYKETRSYTPVAIVPLPALNVSAEQVLDDVAISWDPPVDPNVIGYAIRRGTILQTPDDWASLDVVVDFIDALYFLDRKPIVGGTTQRYFVKSISYTDVLSTSTSSTTYDNINVVEVSNANLCPVGDFDTWTEGTSFAPPLITEVYFADLFTAIRGNATAWTVSRVTGRPDGKAQYAARIQRDAGDTDDADMAIAFSLETNDTVSLRGKYISVSFWVQTGADFESGPGAGLITRLRTNNTTEGSYYEMRGVNSTNQDLVAADGDMSPLPAGTNAWTLMTAAFPNTVAGDAIGMSLAIRYKPTGVAGTNDWLDIAEMAFYATPYYDKSQDPAYRLPPPFQPLTQAARQAYIRRYLLYSSTNETPEFFEQSMRATPLETGASPWKYDARL